MDGKDYLIIIGAAKCGTTSVATFAGSLPEAVLSHPKETLYFTGAKKMSWSGPAPDFAKKLPKNEESFRTAFAANPDARLRIEASTDNLWWPGAAENIKAFSQRSDVGKLRILALFRDPVERIVSEYEHTLKLGWQRCSLLDSLRAEEERKAARWHPLFYHITRSRYAAQLAHYRALFDRNDLLTVDFHSLQDSNFQERLYTFLGYDEIPEAQELGRANERYVPRNYTMHRVLHNKRMLKYIRKIVPQPVRSKARRAVTPKAAGRYRPSSEEIAFIRKSLSNDVAACFADPDIPTDRWSWT